MPVVAQKNGKVFTFTCRQWAAMDNGGGWTPITVDCNGQDAELPRTPFASAANNTSTSGAAASDGDKNYVHIEGVPGTTWEIYHNLNKFPSVTVVDSSGREVVGTIDHVDLTHCTITFSHAFSGKAYVN